VRCAAASEKCKEGGLKDPRVRGVVLDAILSRNGQFGMVLNCSEG
jgi:hypothetical protein